jgi:hypothetical protein
VGPSPFSPYVIAHDDQGRSWTGVRIDFSVASDKTNSVLSEALIVNLEGNFIKYLPTHQSVPGGFEQMHSLTGSGGFFGNQTVPRIYFWDGTNNGGRLCRNGRYLVKITVDDGIKKTYKTIPVVLFK